MFTPNSQARLCLKFKVSYLALLFDVSKFYCLVKDNVVNKSFKNYSASLSFLFMIHIYSNTTICVFIRVGVEGFAFFVSLGRNFEREAIFPLRHYTSCKKLTLLIIKIALHL